MVCTAHNDTAGGAYHLFCYRQALLLLTLLLILCYPCQRVRAQEDTVRTQEDTAIAQDGTRPGHRSRSKFLGFLWKVDSLLTLRYRRISTDTLYVVRPQTKWVIKTRGNLSGATLYIKGMSHGKKYSSLVDSDVKSTLNLSVGYLGLSVGVSVNPASWAGMYKDYEFNLNSYSNRWGVDIVYHNQQSAGGWIKHDGQEEQYIPHGAVMSKTVNLNAYLAFNHRRFSFPAAFSQSYIQRRSAGSWLMGLSLMGQWIESDQSLGANVPVSRMNSINIALGAGYGYNLVMPRNWLLHASALPTLIVWDKIQIWNGQEWKKQQMHVPDFIVTGRLALVKNYRQNFMGASLIFNFSAVGEAERMRIHTTKWRMRLFYGWRF